MSIGEKIITKIFAFFRSAAIASVRTVLFALAALGSSP